MNLIEKIYNMSISKDIDGWSDIHIQEGETLAFRNKSGYIEKELKQSNGENVITYDDIEKLVSREFEEDYDVFNLKKMMKEKEGDIDFSLAIKGEVGEKEKRFRCNLHFFAGRKIGLVMRKINDGAPDINVLGLPELARGFPNKSAGLILVTGPTGSGKSTTLASIIEEINKERDEHIVTVEDPIEYVFESKKCRVTQREVGKGKDSGSFSKALRAALRQDPDIILVGEIRDSETANMALEASQTGHLVLGTLHTKDSVSTINRFVQMFPSSDRGRVRDVLADSLIGVVSQILVPKIGGGKVLACEVMGVTSAIRSCIRDEEKQAEIVHYIETGQNETGMIRLNDYLLNLVVSNMISANNAINYCVNVKDMEKKLKAKGINHHKNDETNTTEGNNVKKLDNNRPENNVKSKSNKLGKIFK